MALKNDPCFKGSPDPSHFIFEIDVGERRIRHWTTLNLNDKFPDRVKIDWIYKSRFMSDPPLSDIDFKNELAWVWTTLKSTPNSRYYLTWKHNWGALLWNTIIKLVTHIYLETWLFTWNLFIFELWNIIIFHNWW